MDADPLKIDAVTQRIRASRVGTVLEPVYSFVSITEVSEYVPSAEQYAERLKREGTSESDPAFQAKLNAYQQRLPAMNQQRLYPDFPALPVMTFYPMNKARHPLANWYTEPFSSRSEMIGTCHIRNPVPGRVSQLITASTGFDDWEWGVTLWSRGRNTSSVYTMRFDKASELAEFGYSTSTLCRQRHWSTCGFDVRCRSTMQQLSVVVSSVWPRHGGSLRSGPGGASC